MKDLEAEQEPLEEVTQPEGLGQAEEGEQPPQPEENQDDDEGEFVVSFGDEGPSDDNDDDEANPVINKIRKKQREAEARAKKLERQLEALKSPVTDVPELGEKPKFDDFDGDDIAFDKAVSNWYDLKQQHDAAEQEAAKRKAEEQARVAKSYQAYAVGKAKIGEEAFADSQDVFVEAIPEVHQNILLQHAKDAASFVYGVARNPAMLDKLSQIKDPVQFAVELGRMEATMKVGRKRPATAPEAKVSPSGAPAGATSKKLSDLKEKGRQTGNYNDYFAAKRAMEKEGS